MKTLNEYFNANQSDLTGKWFQDKLNWNRIKQIKGSMGIFKEVISSKYRGVFHGKQKHK